MPDDNDLIGDETNTKVRTKPCWICGQHSYIAMRSDAWKMHDLHNVPLDIAWPEGSADDKLLILTGIHPSCWDEEFPDDQQKEN